MLLPSPLDRRRTVLSQAELPMRYKLLVTSALASGLCIVFPVSAAWKAADQGVAEAAKNEQIAGALAAVDDIDRAAVADDHAAFAALLADDLAVNNPQNSVSVRGATAQRSAAGQISYSRYERVIEYAGLRGNMVLLMGEEIVLPKARSDAKPPGEIHRRFTDLWVPAGSGWKLTARQATIIGRP